MKLNPAQQQAVDHIYGPLLVLAGPGTGKTQLLSARIANILQKTDASPQNILCLTFTESAAQNMRERLTSMILDDAYDVHINTYHGFGSDIIRSYPQYFEDIDLETGKDSRLERPVDELQSLQIITEILEKLPYDSPLLSAKYYPKNVVSTISELKRALYTPDSLEALAKQNLAQVHALSPKIAKALEGVSRFPTKVADALALFTPLLEILEPHDGLAMLASDSLKSALIDADEQGKSTPLTAWKNTWLTKDATNNFIFTSEEEHLRIIALARVFNAYQEALDAKQLYDFDDMILRTINALKTRDELRFNLQETYQFILLDEFQDTNAAQFELVKLLADNPVNEGQPNIFAVGDDDQAIYAFQGARVSNMLAFKESYRDVKVINLTENYRSHPDVLHVAHQVAQQIESRLHYQLEGVEKILQASATNLPKQATIERHEFNAEANEYAWVANRIAALTSNGTHPSEIAILAPQHKYLERVVPFLAKNEVPVSYEKREDILQTSLLRTFRQSAELIVAIAHNNSALMNQLFPQVLSMDFYEIPVQELWQVNWACATKANMKTWAEHALANPILAPHVSAFLKLGLLANTEPLEYVLDYLTGNTSLKLEKDSSYISPLKNYYFSDHSDNLQYYELLTNLSTIREHLRARQAGQDHLLTTQDFLDFILAYEAAEQPLINTHPIAQKDDSVRLMTTYKAKGLEFEHVFLLSVHDDIWGKKARGNSNKLGLPANLQHVRYRGSSEDELRRLLFVSITRAKHGLYLTSHAMKDNGKATEPVKYLLEFSDGDSRKSAVLPEKNQQVNVVDYEPSETMQAVDTLWHSRHLHLTADLKSLLQERLAKYQMSPTHLNTFIDTEYGGPEVFLLQTLLRFPQAPGEDGEFGNAIHGTLDWYQHRLNEQKPQSLQKILAEFDKQLDKRYIASNRLDDFRARGHHALKIYIPASETMFKKQAQSEVDFRKEGVIVGEAHLTGKLDRIEINEQNKTIDIVDYKTGKPATKWDTSIKLQKYRQQLYFYKLLIEGSHTFAGYKVNSARLEFIEPLPSGECAPALYVDFSDAEEKATKALITEIWSKIQNLDF